MINDRVKAIRIVFQRDPTYAMYTVLDDGSIRNKLTGTTYSGENALDTAIAATRKIPLSDIRRFGPSISAAEGKIGGDVIKNQVDAVNRYLLGARDEQLRASGLGRLIGKQIDATYLLFNFQSNENLLATVLDPSSEYGRFPGFTNLTDEGIQRLSFGISGEGSPLSVVEQTILRSLAGASSLRPSFVEEFYKKIGAATRGEAGALEKIGRDAAKIPKRFSSEIAPRDVSFGEEELDRILRAMSSGRGARAQLAIIHDRTDLLLRAAAGQKIEGLQAFILAAHGGQIRKGTFLGSSEAMGILARVSGISGADPTELLDDPDDLYGLLKQQIEEAGRMYATETAAGRSPSMLNILQQNAETLLGTSPEDPRMIRYSQLIGRLEGNLETFSDGSYTITENFAQRALAEKQNQIKSVKELYSSSGPLTIEQMEEIRKLELEYDSLNEALRNKDLGRDPARIGLGYGSLKGEAGIKSFEDFTGYSIKEVRGLEKRRAKLLRIRASRKLVDAEREELDKLNDGFLDQLIKARSEYMGAGAIADVSALKKETGETRYLAMNIAKSHKKDVYEEPMQLLTDPTSYTDPDYIARQEAVTKRVIGQISSFRRTGEMPQEVMDQLMKEGREIGIDTSDPLFRRRKSRWC